MTETAQANLRMTQFKADLRKAGYVAVLLPIQQLPGIKYELSRVKAERNHDKNSIDLILGQIRNAE